VADEDHEMLSLSKLAILLGRGDQLAMSKEEQNGNRQFGVAARHQANNHSSKFTKRTWW
jgi:hypothetical protein